jgi:hypothetical protein
MTMIDTHARDGITTASDRAAWHEVDEGFWVGNTDGRFLGTIERHGRDRYFARDAVRAYVGEYRTLAAARTAIVDHDL